MKSVTYYFDKDKYGVLLCKNDRTRGNIITDTTTGEAIGKFVEMLIDTIDRMQDNETLILTVTKA